MNAPDSAENPPENQSESPKFDAVAEAKLLLRTVRWATLATLTPDSGAPFATLVNVASAPDGSPILLMSQLAAHRRHIAADPRVSLLFYLPKKGDPLAHPRLTLGGRAIVVEDAAERTNLRARFLARHPKSGLYADFPDFSFFRVALDSLHLNGGFGRAAPGLTVEQILTPVADAAELVAGEAGALQHVNQDHADFAPLLAQAFGQENGRWRTLGFDPEGVDLGNEEMNLRLLFPQPIATLTELRQALVALAHAART
ncbi:MAG: HugZ family protein [Methylovirgula sp.]